MLRRHWSGRNSDRFDVFELVTFILTFVGAFTSSCLSQTASPARSETSGLAVAVILAALIIFGIHLRIKGKRRRQLIVSGKLPVVIRRYTGTESSSHAAFQKNALAMAAHNYFPTSQSWAPGRWGVGHFIVALLLCLILIGILAFIYMLVVKPSGTLTVTYERRAASAKVKTCPRCAEQIKAAALVCHFCGQEFAVEEAGGAPQISVDRQPPLEPLRKLNVKAVVGFLIVLGLTVVTITLGIKRSTKSDVFGDPTTNAIEKDTVSRQETVQTSNTAKLVEQFPPQQEKPLPNDPSKDGLAAYQRGDYATAMKLWRPLADQGLAPIQLSLGVMYAKGQGVSQDYVEAIRWFRRAAGQGNVNAQYYLGSFYVEGKGAAQSYAEAQRWYRKAAEQGNASAQYELGVIYEHGLGVTTSFSEAMQWYRKAADQGNGDAQHNLGAMYASGQGVPQNYAIAASWYRKAADQGVADFRQTSD